MRIDFSIAKDGSVKDVRVVKSSNYPALDDAAITAVKLASRSTHFRTISLLKRSRSTRASSTALFLGRQG